MSEPFETLPTATRQLYLDQAALRLNLSPVVLEKDFWVCWVLQLLFDSDFGDAVVFKGGTSLSKVFGVIDRFSEDVDLSLSPGFLKLHEPGDSRNQANKWMKEAEAACTAAVRDHLAPQLEAAASQKLDDRERPWFEFRVDELTRSPVLLFHYPGALPTGYAYLHRSVKLEFGSLTDQQPAGRHGVRPWIADALPEAFTDWTCEVVALETERTFWEKATILHAEYHRPADKKTPDRFSRHYADTAALAAHPAGQAAMIRTDLLDDVVRWKRRFFGSSWASYDTARPGSLQLAPPAARQADLRRDYQAMRDMYLKSPPSFDEVMAVLARLQDTINQSSGAV